MMNARRGVPFALLQQGRGARHLTLTKKRNPTKCVMRDIFPNKQASSPQPSGLWSRVKSGMTRAQRLSYNLS